MLKWLLGLFFLVTSMLLHNHALGCDCWFPDYYVILTASTTDYDPQSNSEGNIDSCSHPGDSPGEVECQAAAGKSNVFTWQVSGGITGPMLKCAGFNLSGNVGSNVEKTFSASSKATINAFCKRCHAESGHEYTITTYTIGCTRCPSWSVTGNYKVYNGQYSKANTSSQPVPPCVSDCSASE
jgi:hypothetical protein